jgi:hypothetical protein
MTKEALADLLEAVEAAIEAGDWKVDGACDPDLAIRQAKQALAQPEQEPVAWVCMTDQYSKIVRFEWETFGNVTPLYTTPPQRKPLTDEQIGKILDDPNIAEKNQGNWLVLPYAYARAIEAAHGIKE